MIDLHCHILPEIDDGAVDIDTSIEMVKIALKEGIKHIILTPHYICTSIDNNASVILKKYTEFVDRLKEEELDIQVYPGSEVFISPEIPQLVEEGLICTLNNSSYVLIELPMMSLPIYTKEILFQLNINGFTPIIAHPERNIEISKDPNILYELISRGVLSQVNATSLTGLNGTKVRETALTLLRHGMVHFIASDAHTCRGRAPRLLKSREIVRSEMGEDIAINLFEKNGLSVINNKEIDIADPIRVDRKRKYFIPFLQRFC